MIRIHHQCFSCWSARLRKHHTKIQFSVAKNIAVSERGQVVCILHTTLDDSLEFFVDKVQQLLAFFAVCT